MCKLKILEKFGVFPSDFKKSDFLQIQQQKQRGPALFSNSPVFMLSEIQPMVRERTHQTFLACIFLADHQVSLLLRLEGGHAPNNWVGLKTS